MAKKPSNKEIQKWVNEHHLDTGMPRWQIRTALRICRYDYEEASTNLASWQHNPLEKTIGALLDRIEDLEERVERGMCEVDQ